MGKYIDMLVYYKRVKYCCFGRLTSKFSADIIQVIVELQRILPQEYRIDYGEEHDFDDIFKEYRMELLDNYMNENYLFAAKYSARELRKYFNVEKFREKYGGNSKYTLFFTQTLCDYLSMFIFYQRTDDFMLKSNTKELSAKGIVFYKMYLATLLVREILGYSIYYEIERVEELLNKNKCENHVGIG